MTLRHVELNVSEWHDVTSWRVVSEENRGLREKRWVQDPEGNIWLRKQHRASRPYEPAIEVFALDLARFVGIESARATLARWQEGGSSKAGVAVLYFCASHESLIAGNEVLGGADRRYDYTNKSMHTFDRVVSALTLLEMRTGSRLVEPFAAMLLFDGWIGNSDRHPANWSLIKGMQGLRFSPMYDPAGALGAELGDDRPVFALPTSAAQVADLDRHLDRYVTKCPSGFGNGKKLVRLGAVMASLKAAGLLSSVVLARFEAAMLEVPDMLERFSETDLPPPRRRFMLQILNKRLGWLRSL